MHCLCIEKKRNKGIGQKKYLKRRAGGGGEKKLQNLPKFRPIWSRWALSFFGALPFLRARRHFFKFFFLSLCGSAEFISAR
jgi:hypothetical protein